MALSWDTPFVCPILVGRADIAAKLDDHINGARSGAGRVVFVAGEAGIGKSRLLAEVKASAQRKQFLVAQGRCFDLDQTLPFAPLIDLLRGLLSANASADLARNLMANRSEFARLLPELSNDSQDTAKTPELNFEQDKRQLFDLLLQFFLRLASRHPLLLAVEDLHWSDPTSLEFLAYFTRRVPQTHILVLLTYRSDEASPELLSFLADLERERLVSEFALVRLTRDETVTLLNGVLGAEGTVSAEVTDSIYALTEGNPFFVEEIAKSMVTTGKIIHSEGVWRLQSASEPRLPRTVQVAVQQRLKLLRHPAYDVLVLASVAGRRFNFALLQALTGHDEDTLIGLIKDLISAQLVVEETAETFAFRHALTREAVYLSLLARERRTLHSTVAAAMEHLYAVALDVHCADLTYQYYQAQNWAKVLEFAPRAAEQAQNLYSARAAISLYTQVFEAAQHSGLTLPWAVYR